MSRALHLAALTACLCFSLIDARAIATGKSGYGADSVGQRIANAGPARSVGAASGARRGPAETANEPLHYLSPIAFDPSRLVPAPPAIGSEVEILELARLHKLRLAASSERLARARWDGDHEDPAVFDSAAGRDLKKLPATWALLTIVQKETDAVIDRAKVHFNRTRPWGVDSTLPYCDKGKRKLPTHSYPSGHSGLGYSVGWTLAQLLPNRAPQILARAEDYALSREICGVHFPSDTEASHVIGTLTAATLFADPRLAHAISQSRAELRDR